MIIELYFCNKGKRVAKYLSKSHFCKRCTLLRNKLLHNSFPRVFVKKIRATEF